MAAMLVGWLIGSRPGTLRIEAERSGGVFPPGVPVLMTETPQPDPYCYPIKGLTTMNTCHSKWESEHCTAEGVAQKSGWDAYNCVGYQRGTWPAWGSQNMSRGDAALEAK